MKPDQSQIYLVIVIFVIIFLVWAYLIKHEFGLQESRFDNLEHEILTMKCTELGGYRLLSPQSCVVLKNSSDWPDTEIEKSYFAEGTEWVEIGTRY